MCCGRYAPCLICFLLLTIVSLSVASLIFLVIFRPQELKFTIDDMSMKQFDLSSSDNSTFFYNLTLNITVRNPNKKVGVFYDRVQVIANYQKKSFTLVTLNSTTPFYQGHKNTTVLSTVLQGQERLSFKERDIEKYNLERSSGVFRVDVKIALRVRTKYGKFKSPYFKPSKIDCDKLKVPLSINNATSATLNIFTASKCKNVYVILPPPGL